MFFLFLYGYRPHPDPPTHPNTDKSIFYFVFLTLPLHVPKTCLKQHTLFAAISKCHSCCVVVQCNIIVEPVTSFFFNLSKYLMVLLTLCNDISNFMEFLGHADPWPSVSNYN